MKEYKFLEELRPYRMFLLNRIISFLEEEYYSDPLIQSLGGNVFEIESDIDFDSKMAEPLVLSEWDTFDVHGDYAVVSVMNNNSGGPTFIVPLGMLRGTLGAMSKAFAANRTAAVEAFVSFPAAWQ